MMVTGVRVRSGYARECPGGNPQQKCVCVGGPRAVLAVIARGIQEQWTLKALVLLDAGEGLTVDAFEQID